MKQNDEERNNSWPDWFGSRLNLWNNLWGFPFQISQQIFEISRKCLENEPTERPKANEIVEMISSLFPNESQIVSSIRECKVFCDNEINSRLKPCLHSILCGDCANMIQSTRWNCPYCNVRIESIEIGFFNQTF